MNDILKLIERLEKITDDNYVHFKLYSDGSGEFKHGYTKNYNIIFEWNNINDMKKITNNYLEEEYFPVAENLPNLEPTFGQISQNMSTINSVANNINEVTELPERGLNLRDINADFEQYGYLDDKQVQYLLDRTEQLSHALVKVHEYLWSDKCELQDKSEVIDSVIERVIEAQESLV